MGSFGLALRLLGVALALAVFAPSAAFARDPLPADDQGLCDSLNRDAQYKYEYGSWLDYKTRMHGDNSHDARMTELKGFIDQEPLMAEVVTTLNKRYAERRVPFAPKAACFYTGPNATLRNFGLVPPPWISSCEVDPSTPDSDSLLAVLGTLLPPDETKREQVAAPDSSKGGAPAPGTQGIGTIGFYQRFNPEDQKTARIRFAENLWEKYRSCDYQISWLVNNVHGPTDDITSFAWRYGCNSWASDNRGFFDELVNDAAAFPEAPVDETVAGQRKASSLDEMNPLPPRPPRPGHLVANFNGAQHQLSPATLFFREYDLAYKSLTFCASILNRTYPPNTKRFLCNNSNLLGGLMFGAVALLNGKTTSATSAGLATLGGLLVTANPITCASTLGGQGGANVLGGSGTGKGGGASSSPKQPSSKPPR